MKISRYICSTYMAAYFCVYVPACEKLF